MFRIICLLIGYVFGCFQTSYIIGRITKNIDIRDHGSKNAGTTNTLRVLGITAGAVVLVIDIIKALLAFLLAAWIFKNSGYGILPGLYAGLGTVLGHDFPFLLKFKGGKGVASSLGVYLGSDWRAALILYAVGLLTAVTTRYVSLASLLITLFAPLLFWLFGYGPEATAVMTVMAVIAWVLHQGNIKRLVTGTERKFSIQK